MSDIQPTYREYWNEIRAIAESVLQYGDDYGDLPESVDTALVNHEFLIGRNSMLLVLFHSPNDEAYIEDFGEVKADDFDALLSLLATHAMRADVAAEVGRIVESRSKS